MAAVRDRVAETIARWDGFAGVEALVFGTADPGRIEDAVAAFCRDHLGAGPAGCRFYEVSVGCVFGLDLGDGRAVVLKAYQPAREPAARLDAVSAVQRHLADAGFPCPAPVAGPAPLGLGHATVETLLDRGEHRDAHDPAVRRAMAELLARLVRLARPLARDAGVLGPLLRGRADGLWPPPHSPVFDFRATAGRGAWIDRIAAPARAVLDRPAGDRVTGHTDWSVKHLRFAGPQVVAVYDWDSLALEAEPVLVGSAARAFTMTWDLPVRLVPTPAEAGAFVREYEAARGAPFSPAERETMHAAAVYLTAYTARCQTALMAPDEAPEPGSHLEALRDHGAALVSLP